MTTNLIPVRRALLSVSDKTGLIELARSLAARNIELLSTGGTAKAIREAGLLVKDVSQVTGFPEIMDGRVKTLHPKIHGGLLGRRGIDAAVMAEQGIEAIDLLVLNLYPFERVTAQLDARFDDIIENIDIGGPAMLRAAAKNFAHVAVATDPSQYASLVKNWMRTRASSLQAPVSPWRWPRSTVSPNTMRAFPMCSPPSSIRTMKARETARSSRPRPTAIS